MAAQLAARPADANAPAAVRAAVREYVLAAVRRPGEADRRRRHHRGRRPTGRAVSRPDDDPVARYIAAIVHGRLASPFFFRTWRRCPRGSTSGGVPPGRRARPSAWPSRWPTSASGTTWSGCGKSTPAETARPPRGAACHYRQAAPPAVSGSPGRGAGVTWRPGAGGRSPWRRARSAAPRPAASPRSVACWYSIAIAGLACPRRRISCLVVAPASAAHVAPVCRRSWNRRSGRPAAVRARFHSLEHGRLVELPAARRGEQQPVRTGLRRGRAGARPGPAAGTAGPPRRGCPPRSSAGPATSPAGGAGHRAGDHQHARRRGRHRARRSSDSSPNRSVVYAASSTSIRHGRAHRVGDGGHFLGLGHVDPPLTSGPTRRAGPGTGSPRSAGRRRRRSP